ncbi:hypothetical protein NE237_029216 [Protea cynaroides]|uniref:Uncharacterized protein n=1 Tax=Protea cynaroides TaxID=273540 RepID=A0A9Q0JTK9_9MAGN|nr:hypothetical protein NE237_029216 [Protea cynaroides]
MVLRVVLRILSLNASRVLYVLLINSIGRYSAVCKRFNSLVPLVQDVYIKIDEVVANNGENDENTYCSSHKLCNFFSNILKYMFFSIDLPLDAPSKIQSCVRNFSEHFRFGWQEDAHEFLVNGLQQQQCRKGNESCDGASAGGGGGGGGGIIIKIILDISIPLDRLN